jgi:hypothetical protein
MMPTWGWIVIGVVAGLGLLWLVTTIYCALILGAREDEAKEKAWQEYRRQQDDLLSELDSNVLYTPPSKE